MTATPTRQPTLTLAIPFPEPPASSSNKNIPPFLLYAPLAASLKPPTEGEKESLANKATRKWQETDREARTQRESGEGGVKAKAIGFISKAMSATKNSRVEFLTRTPAASELKELRIVYPEGMSAEDIQKKFTDVLKATKNAAIRNGIIATAALPFVFVIDTLTFIPGPFEINTVFAIASWTSASRASTISNGVEQQTVTCGFSPDSRLDALVFRLHELCWANRKPTTPMEPPRWKGEHEPLRGIELAALVLALVNHHLELGACEGYERDLTLVEEDLEQVLLKGAKEWLACIA